MRLVYAACQTARAVVLRAQTDSNLDTDLSHVTDLLNVNRQPSFFFTFEHVQKTYKNKGRENIENFIQYP